MKYHTYKYQENGVTLEFSFKDDKEVLQNKDIFINLLDQASRDLKDELQKP